MVVRKNEHPRSPFLGTREDLPCERAERLSNMRLYVLITSSVARRPAEEIARLVVEGGADVVQLREKNDVTDRELLRRACAVREITRGRALFIVNDRPDICVLSDADGVHVGQDDLPPEEARKIIGSERILGVSTHCLDQALAAIGAGADYIGVGPMFPTKTRGYTKGVGPAYVREILPLQIPFVALGGITLDNLGQVLDVGARAVAICSAIIAAENPRGAAEAFRALLRPE